MRVISTRRFRSGHRDLRRAIAGHVRLGSAIAGWLLTAPKPMCFPDANEGILFSGMNSAMILDFSFVPGRMNRLTRRRFGLSV
jgi:hypothetical protein